MSSKEQYKDALKRANRTITQLQHQIHVLTTDYHQAIREVNHFKEILEKTKIPKKWWQFWK